MVFNNAPIYNSGDDGFMPPQLGGTIGVLIGTINYSDVGAKTLFTIPKGAVPVLIMVSVETDFNAGTDNNLDIGWGTDGDYFANDVAVGTQGNFLPDTSGFVAGRYGVQLTTEDVLTAEYTQTGTAAGTGKAHIILFYMLGGEMYISD